MKSGAQRGENTNSHTHWRCTMPKEGGGGRNIGAGLTCQEHQTKGVNAQSCCKRVCIASTLPQRSGIPLPTCCCSATNRRLTLRLDAADKAGDEAARDGERQREKVLRV